MSKTILLLCILGLVVLAQGRPGGGRPGGGRPGGRDGPRPQPREGDDPRRGPGDGAGRQDRGPRPGDRGDRDQDGNGDEPAEARARPANRDGGPPRESRRGDDGDRKRGPHGGKEGRRGNPMGKYLCKIDLPADMEADMPDSGRRGPPRPRLRNCTGECSLSLEEVTPEGTLTKWFCDDKNETSGLPFVAEFACKVTQAGTIEKDDCSITMSGTEESLILDFPRRPPPPPPRKEEGEEGGEEEEVDPAEGNPEQ